MRILPALVALLAITLSGAQALDVTIMSFNIRWASPDDGANVWPQRKTIAAHTIARSGAEIVGLQEALASQLADLKKELPEYESIGVGRDDGKEAGEFSAILYDAEKFAVEKGGTFWLSETPDEPGSMSWETACTRIATWGIFRAKSDGSRFLVLNTHLDHRSAQAREEGAKLIAAKIHELADGLPVVVTGDFNAPQDSVPLQTLASPATLRHAREMAGLPPRSTFNGFQDDREGSEIDHILASPEIEAKTFEVLEVKEGGVYVSDHWPIVARLAIP